MKGFVIVPQPYDRLPEYLLEVSPGFAESPEYLALDQELRSIPGLVVGAWGGYLRRVFSAQEGDEARRYETGLLGRLFEVLESLCSSEDGNVVNAVMVEIFEHLHEGDDWHARFRSVLGPAARNVYETMRPDPDWSSPKG